MTGLLSQLAPFVPALVPAAALLLAIWWLIVVALTIRSRRTTRT